MKIICTKEEFATLLSCCAASNSCGECALFEICENPSTLVDICEIKQQEEQK